MVIQAGAIGDNGGMPILDMSEPVKILKVAERLVQHSGREIETIFTGLRPNEKMHQVLFSDDELDQRPHYPLISRVAVSSLAPTELKNEKSVPQNRVLPYLDHAPNTQNKGA